MVQAKKLYNTEFFPCWQISFIRAL